MIGPTLTRARFEALCTFPEMFSGISDAVYEAVAEACVDRIAGAFGDRATYPITSWDAACELHAVHLICRVLMGHRGYDPNQGDDKEIVRLAELAEEFRRGIMEKREQPYFVDSSANGRPVGDAPRIMSSRTSDAFVERRRSWRRGCW